MEYRLQKDQYEILIKYPGNGYTFATTIDDINYFGISGLTDLDITCFDEFKKYLEFAKLEIVVHQIDKYYMLELPIPFKGESEMVKMYKVSSVKPQPSIEEIASKAMDQKIQDYDYLFSILKSKERPLFGRCKNFDVCVRYVNKIIYTPSIHKDSIFNPRIANKYKLTREQIISKSTFDTDLYVDLAIFESTSAHRDHLINEINIVDVLNTILEIYDYKKILNISMQEYTSDLYHRSNKYLYVYFDHSALPEKIKFVHGEGFYDYTIKCWTTAKSFDYSANETSFNVYYDKVE